MEKSTSSKFRHALFFVAFLILAVNFLETISLHFTNNFWNDAISHHGQVVESRNFSQLQIRLKHELQPLFDYVLRKYIWYPILGSNERGIRFPDTFAAFLLLLFSVGALFRAFKASRLPLTACGAFAIAFGVWLVQHPVIVKLISESRHYELTALVSVVWFYLQFVGTPRRGWLYYLATLIFANTHFFSLPLLGSAFLWDTALRLRQRHFRPAVLHSLLFATVTAVTLYLNWTAFSFLLQRPWPVTAPLTMGYLLFGAKEIYLTWFRLFFSPVSYVLLLLALASAVVKPRRVGFFLLLFFTFPAFCLFVRLRSQYPYFDRYYQPFFGFTFVIYAWGSETAANLGLRIWSHFQSRLDSGKLRRFSRAIEPVFLLGVLLLPGTRNFISQTYRRLHKIQIPAANFTQYYWEYGRLKPVPGPLIIIVEARDRLQASLSNFYLRKYESTGNVREVLSEDRTQRHAGLSRDVEQLLARQAGVGVIFEMRARNQPCPKDLSERIKDLPLQDFKFKNACFFMVRDIRSLRQAAEVAQKAGFTLKWL